MSHGGYVIDKSLKDGDLCFQGPLKIFTGKMTRSLFTGAIDQSVEVHPWHPALPNVARWLSETPNAVDRLWHVLDIYGNSRHAEVDAEQVLSSLIVALTPTEAPDADR